MADVAEFAESVRRVAAGGTVLDPELVLQLLTRSRRREPLARLTSRESEVLSLMAGARSNTAIAAALVVTEAAVEKHVSSIFSKLDVPPAEHDHRRVLAVLRWLQRGEEGSPRGRRPATSRSARPRAEPGRHGPPSRLPVRPS